ncbi:GNAT family N-acetyltransferase [Bryobacter aggregatus]|uniref:GNAT family N-acetyltransferase n=1 Tax=Bryobacter aggregatus TaxID=360054 RepID=UPI0004E27594|nr:GNAT family N-acetyltransferase [Bryobacter aggregatus]
MNTRILQASDPEWTELLRSIPHDFYHTAAYHAFSERVGEGDARMAVADEADRCFVWPYLQRRAQAAGCDPSAQWFDVHSVYGYPGPLTNSHADPAFIGRAVRSVLARWQEEGVVSVFSRFHPLLGNSSILRQAGFADAVVSNGRTVALDLTQSTEQFRAQYPISLRQRLNRAERLGVTTTVDEDFEHLDQFIDFYYATMDRNAASEGYYFPRSYFHALVRDIAPHMKLLLTRIQGQVAVASLFSACGTIAQAHFIMTNPEFMALSPSKSAIDHARIWAAEQGCLRLHLGGGRGGDSDSLFRFKAEFSPCHFDFDTCRLIVNQDAYSELSGERAAAASALCFSADAPAYFPAYRAALPTAKVSSNEVVHAF